MVSFSSRAPSLVQRIQQWIQKIKHLPHRIYFQFEKLENRTKSNHNFTPANHSSLIYPNLLSANKAELPTQIMLSSVLGMCPPGASNLIRVPGDPLFIQLPADILEKLLKMPKVFGILSCIWEIQEKLLATEDERDDRYSLCIFFSFCLFFFPLSL